MPHLELAKDRWWQEDANTFDVLRQEDVMRQEDQEMGNPGDLGEDLQATVDMVQEKTGGYRDREGTVKYHKEFWDVLNKIKVMQLPGSLLESQGKSVSQSCSKLHRDLGVEANGNGLAVDSHHFVRAMETLGGFFGEWLGHVDKLCKWLRDDGNSKLWHYDAGVAESVS